jgi:opacity protein-like surface antigen
MLRHAAIALWLTCASAPAAAQTLRPVEMFGGYAFVHDPKNDVSLPAGWIAGGAFRLTDWLSAIADASGGYRTDDAFGAPVRLSAHALLVGARASARIGRLVEFGQLLAGVVRGSGSAFGFTDASTAFALQPGAGVDYPLSRRLAARGEIDVRFIRNQPNGNEAGYEYRFAAALVYRLTR